MNPPRASAKLNRIIDAVSHATTRSRADDVKMETALEAADVEVERRDYDGVAHEFFGCAAVLEKAREAQQFAGERLRQAFAES